MNGTHATPTERLVFHALQRTCLPPWTHLRPLNESGKELCDALVICSPDVIAVSVKEVRPRRATDDPPSWERWQRRAIEAAHRQLQGATRRLSNADEVQTTQGPVKLPAPSERRVHQIVVAYGGRSSYPVLARAGTPYVHVFRGATFELLCRNLDTITDFLGYLKARSDLLSARDALIDLVGEKSLLALFVMTGGFPERLQRAPGVEFSENFWSQVRRDGRWRKEKELNRLSYLWDGIIKQVAEQADMPSPFSKFGFPHPEPLYRHLSREPRLKRRFLAGAVMRLLAEAPLGGPPMRFLRIDNGTAYVFKVTPRKVSQATAGAQLAAGCIQAHRRHPDAIVVGIDLITYGNRSSQLRKGLPLLVRGSMYVQAGPWHPDVEAAADDLLAQYDWRDGGGRKRRATRFTPL